MTEDDSLRVRPAYLTWTHPQGFRPGHSALISGVMLLHRKDGTGWRPVFCLTYPDGMVDYAPLEDGHNFVITGTPYDGPEKQG